MQINPSLCRTSDHYFSLSLQQLSRDSLGAKNLSKAHAQNFCKVKQLWLQKSHRVFPEIVQTSPLGRLQRKSLKHSNCFYVASISQRRGRKLPTNNIPSPQNYFQTIC